MSLRQAAQQALEALEWNYNTDLDNIPACEQWAKMLNETVAALRAALAEPEQEPVAWRTFDGEGGWDYRTYEDNEHYRAEYIKRNGENYASWVEPLYTAPPEAVEPIAWMVYTDGGTSAYVTDNPNDLIGAYRALPLFTAPTPRKPLTDEEMRECAQSMNAEPLAEGWPELIKFARAIERAHGIGEQT